MEDVALYIGHHIKPLATKDTSKLQDIPDFLRKLEQMKQEGILPKK